MILVFDTETTGLPAFNLPAEDPSQPHIVQLVAILYDNNRRVISELNVLVLLMAGRYLQRQRLFTESRTKRR